MLRIEHDEPEPLDGAGSVLRQQKRRELTRRGQLRPIRAIAYEGAAPELHCSQYLRRPRPSKSRHLSQIPEARARQPVKAVGLLQQPVRQFQRVAASRPTAEDERQQLVITKSGRAEALELLAWAIVRRNILHVYTQASMRCLPATAWLLTALLVSACGTPPDKEMNQAQGAIDAARAAGADRYAREDFEAAIASLELSEQAVAQRDYRLALNHALDSREHAQNAAREAAEARARLRGEVERTMAEIAGLLAQANARLDAAEKARVPRRTLADSRSALAQVNDDVQKAGEAIRTHDYMAAAAALVGVKERIEMTIAALEEAARTQPPRRRR